MQALQTSDQQGQFCDYSNKCSVILSFKTLFRKRGAQFSIEV